jgi:hypothetical protein
MFFEKKEEAADKLLVKHFEVVGNVLDEFRKMFVYYIQSDKRFKEQAFRIHTMEHEADLIRREVQLKLYEGAFLPIYREDYVTLAESVDKIANTAEDVGDYLVLTRPAIPDFLVEDLMKMIDETVKGYEPLKDSFNLMRADMSKLFEIRNKVGESEQSVDSLYWDLTKKAFKSDIELARKLHLKGLLDLIGKITNRMEDVADHFEIMAIKRKL